MNWVGKDKIYGLGWEKFDLWIGLGGRRAKVWVGRDESYGLGWEG